MKKKLVYVFVIMAVVCLPQLLWAVTVNNLAYQVETYIIYDASGLGRCRDFTFDSVGNIYVTHTLEDNERNGSIKKISTDGTISAFRSDLVAPRQIVWGGDTTFGDYLYVTDGKEKTTWSRGEVTKFDLAGNKTPFCGGVNSPETLAIDKTGNYNNLLYITNSSNDKILSIGASGGIATTFSNYPYGQSGAIFGMAFDTTGNYGGRMFVGGNLVDMQYGGLFRIDINGVESRYTNFERASCIAIDDTPEQFFHGKMYAAGRQISSTKWTLYQVNGYYDTEVFGTFDISSIGKRPEIEFGPDGAMYTMEWDDANQDVIISRIMLTLETTLVQIDIKPQLCPNPLNVKSNGVLPVAILGSELIDVNEIDITSLEIFGVQPIRSGYKDVASIASDIFPEDCLCNTEGTDGYSDLIMKFDTHEIVEAIGFVDDGDYVILTLTGFMKDGTSFEGFDCVEIAKKGSVGK